MINKVPGNWEYDKNLEMLFLFYQKTDELLNFTTPDTYALPLHNPITLICEMKEILDLLEKHNMLDKYYYKYIPPIIEEFLLQLKDDYVLKKLLIGRLDSICTGFSNAIGNYISLSKWISIFQQSCTLSEYEKNYKNEIARLTIETSDKHKLVYCTANYFTLLVYLGYSKEYLYIMTRKFFSDGAKQINDPKQIKEFLHLFTCRKKRYDFLILMNINDIEYMDGISDNLIYSRHITPIDIGSERKKLCEDYTVEALFKEYDNRLYNKRKNNKISVVRFYDEALDPYSAADNFNKYIRFLQNFTKYFKHFYYSKQIYKILYIDDDSHYKEIRLPRKILKRPHIDQKTVDHRIRNILQAKAMSFNAFGSITDAIEMHSEAFDSRNTILLVKTFWTALETLFFNTSSNSVRDNVINSVLQIIQKTYMLKVFRLLYSQLTKAIDPLQLKQIGISDFLSFLKYFSANEYNSEEMKKIYKLLELNPLLRGRLYSLRKTLSDGKSIAKYLDSHSNRIEWQLNRLYRIRNIATHLGVEVSGVDIAANHLHNYFDYIVNYMLCKSEKGDYIVSTTAVVFEAKNDNQIHYEFLKHGKTLSTENYMDYLFGPDHRLAEYEFEY